jgi:hypothetical protein
MGDSSWNWVEGKELFMERSVSVYPKSYPKAFKPLVDRVFLFKQFLHTATLYNFRPYY